VLIYLAFLITLFYVFTRIFFMNFSTGGAGRLAGLHRRLRPVQSRGSRTMENYLLAGRSMPWYAMALSIMATQAGAITFISTPGQSYIDGMRFVQFYFGLPLAMVILSATAVPIFHRSGVYTAYEYLRSVSTRRPVRWPA